MTWAIAGVVAMIVGVVGLIIYLGGWIVSGIKIEDDPYDDGWDPEDDYWTGDNPDPVSYMPPDVPIQRGALNFKTPAMMRAEKSLNDAAAIVRSMKGPF